MARVRSPDGGAPFDVYVNFECSAAPSGAAGAASRRPAGATVSVAADSPPGSCHDPPPRRVSPPAVSLRRWPRFLPASAAGRAGLGGRHPGDARGRRGPARRLRRRRRASGRSRTPRRRSARCSARPDRFMAMVRGSYPVVYRPSAVTFLHPHGSQGQWIAGRAPDRCRRRPLARRLPARAAARQVVAHQRLQRAAERRQDDLSGGGCLLPRHRHRQHPPQVGAVRRGHAGRRRCSTHGAVFLEAIDELAESAVAATCRRRRACSAASSPAKACAAAPRRSSRLWDVEPRWVVSSARPAA